MALKIVRSGTWKYDGQVDMPVDIIGLDCDWWYELEKADGILESLEGPESLSPEGFLYYARFKDAGRTSEPTWVDSAAHRTIEAAMAEAEAKVTGAITWED